MKLPQEFCDQMEKLLGDDYPAFISSYDHPRAYGLRVNTLKISAEDFRKISPFVLSPIPWERNGFYFPEDDRPAKHPYYHAGLYYLQEPSAMVPGRLLEVCPGDRVLDLCAAPGGKSTQAAAGLQGAGVLVSNDISAERTKALVKNIERFGIKNALITNDTPEKLARAFPEYFNKIILDAPCSGEGTFRKDPEAVRQWGIYSSEKCTMMQKEILHFAARLLAPGGKMVYSTCTFTPEENEKMIEKFLIDHEDFYLEDVIKHEGWENGRTEGTNGSSLGLEKAVRLWPHKVFGEGHFAALLGKKGEAIAKKTENQAVSQDRRLDDFYTFVRENLKIEISGCFHFYGEHLYLQPEGIPDLSGVKVIRPGLYLGMLKKNRFEPSHSMALALKKTDFTRSFDLAADSPQVLQYLKGETLFASGENGWTVVCVDGYPLGWAKQLGDTLKNHYPKGWRRLN